SADPQDPVGARAALAYAAPAADDALRGSLAERAQAKGVESKPADAKSLLTASQPVAVDDTVTAVTAPLPPRRPTDMAAVAASLTMPLPPPRPVQFAALERGMANLAPAGEIRALDKPAAPLSARARALVAPDADAKAQLRALFDSVSAGPGAAPASRAVPVHVAATRLRGTAPDAVVGAAPDRVTTRFSPRSPGDDLPSRFTGSAARPVSGAR
ncbi:MAG: peptidase domain containing protein, partial [Methylobacterium organophilum]|nr:peptidase domain containing protein [Methylobacterium organophilum]